jgi:tubulin-specific chaperone A
MNRNHKELLSYHDEVIKLEARVQKMKDENPDNYDIKKQTEVVDEAKNMIPNTKERLQTSYDDLKQHMVLIVHMTIGTY